MNSVILSPSGYAVLYLSKKNPSEKVALGNRVFNSCSANLNFPEFNNPTLLGLQTSTLNLNNAIFNATGRALERELLIAAVVDFDLKITSIAAQVQAYANLDLVNAATIIASSGLQTRKTPERNQLPDVVSTLNAEFVNSPGQALVTWKHAKLARFYYVYTTTTPAVSNSWVLAGGTTKRKFLVTNLTPEVRCYFRIVSCGASGVSLPSATVNTIAG
jgi:hypothetical protein